MLWRKPVLLLKLKMGRNQRDEPSEPAIVDATATNLTDQKAPVNHLIDAMEEFGIIVKT